MYTLLTDFYPEPDEARRAELRECLTRNLALKLFRAVHLFLEDGLTRADCPELTDPKLTLVEHGKRATFSEYFEYANRNLSGKRIVLANADIFFDGTLGRLNRYNFRRLMVCLARWDVKSDGTSKMFDVPYSQDAWIFQTPVRVPNCDFTLGTPGCENRLAFEARNARLSVQNYARTVHANHLHLTGLRRWTEKQRLHGRVLMSVRPKALR